MKKKHDLPRRLGWLSIGLGVAALLAGRRIGRFLGVSDRSGVIRMVGLREIGTGIGLLGDPRNPDWVRRRLAGDVMDVSFLGSALRSRAYRRGRLALALAGVLGITAMDALAERRLST